MRRLAIRVLRLAPLVALALTLALKAVRVTADGSEPNAPIIWDDGSL